ncbi:MAG: dTDP-4-dehydrorhamnose 3,5-epimerase family protein [Nitrospiraceae bacterium]|nr:MAG: dTDP-4-dehydrorhamnose 3,5-epimerase family protein [Nitrospiraceae bacterium]
MMEGFDIRELSVFEDERGWLTEIFRNDITDFRPVMSYLSMTKSGQIRGPHEHTEQTDYFCFLGKFRLYLWDNREKSLTYQQHKVIDTSGLPTVAVVPAGIVHAYKNVSDEGGMVINMPDRLYKGEGKKEPVDEVRYEDDPASPFRIIE